MSDVQSANVMRRVDSTHASAAELPPHDGMTVSDMLRVYSLEAVSFSRKRLLLVIEGCYRPDVCMYVCVYIYIYLHEHVDE